MFIGITKFRQCSSKCYKSVLLKILWSHLMHCWSSWNTAALHKNISLLYVLESFVHSHKDNYFIKETFSHVFETSRSQHLSCTGPWKTPGSSAKVVQPSATKALWDFYFGCAWENVKSTLRGPTSVLTLLSPSLRDGAKVGMKSSFCLFLSTARYPETPPRSPQSKSYVLWKGNMLWTLRWPVWLRV